MAQLIYSSIASLDGYIADADGNFDWSMPDHEVHSAVNEQFRSIGTQLIGRRLYEIMSFWDTAQDDDPTMAEFAALWADSDKIVYSSTMPEVTAPRTRLERDFRADDVQHLKRVADRDLSIGGPELAAHALRAGLVDEIRIYTSPVIVGGGTALWPADLRLDLELIEERRFGNGVVYTGYRVR
ncbi:deaminase [Glaciihabitans arcticus]|uniref:Deaminase n=1 Tax=Glaciihabitans arcticus TaxID=2668039 RepID=A0A4Q9GNB6_9MICO|nr:dihydrofolate reductase family protein [Glaciihabitans arcticus]TBN56292.1 deaminase [Glaciihabitans arcticus]